MYNAQDTIIRALNSIPERDYIEIIVVDDCSEDNSLQIVRDYQMNSEKNICVLYNHVNMGVGYTVNRIIDNTYGEYLILLGSDDYFIELEEFLNKIIGKDYDLAYFNLEDNSKQIYNVNEETKHYYCGSVKAMRRAFIGDIRCPNIRYKEDHYFYEELLKKNPKEWFSGMLVKHYNYPRKNSLVWRAIHEDKEIR